MGKYQNRAILYDGKYFPSKLELLTYQELSSLNYVDSICHQYKIKLTASISWIVDFQVTVNSNIYFVESKGIITETFLIKFKLVKDLHPELLPKVIFVVNDNRALKKVKKFHPLVLTVKQIKQTFTQYVERERQ